MLQENTSNGNYISNTEFHHSAVRLDMRKREEDSGDEGEEEDDDDDQEEGSWNYDPNFKKRSGLETGDSSSASKVLALI